MGFWIAIGASALVVAGVYLWRRITLARYLASMPRTWSWNEPAPDGVATALEVLRVLLPPRERWGGEIVFVDGPFDVEGVVAYGTVEMTKPRVLLARFPRIEQTALAHELAHWCGASEYDARAFAAKANPQIAAALGR